MIDPISLVIITVVLKQSRLINISWVWALCGLWLPLLAIILFFVGLNYIPDELALKILSRLLEKH
jgi:hypothetical protein